MTANRKNASIYLCGFMGCGKTTVGKLLAKKLGKKLIDLDWYIEDKEKMTIPEIFEKKGEPYFRKKESEALAKLKASGAVVATGGGALLTEANGNIAKNSGLVIYIDTPFKDCYKRIKGDKNRPIAYNSTKEQLKDRYDQRRPLYIQNSHFAVDGKGFPTEIAQRIIDIYEKDYFGNLD